MENEQTSVSSKASSEQTAGEITKTSTKKIAEQAAEWILLLGEADSEQQQQLRIDFEQWQQQDPLHAQAAQRVEGFVAQLSFFKDTDKPQHAGASKALKASLQQSQHRRRKKISHTVLGLFLIFTLPAAILLQNYPLAYLAADMQASSGQWHSHTLSDGSHITLAGKTALNININSQQRTLTLLSGEVYVDVAPDTTRPFVVETEYGSIQALGTRFIVNHLNNNKTRLSMIESKVLVTPASPTATTAAIIKAGEQIKLSANGLSPISVLDTAMQENRWQQHQLLVQGWTLAEVLSELSRFHRGYIHFNAEDLQTIQVSAVLPLNKPEQALALLAESFPTIQVQQFTPWLVIVKKAVKKL